MDCFSTCRLSAPQGDTEHLSPGVDSQNHLGQPAGLGDPHGLGLGGQLLLDGGHHVRLGHFSGCCLGWLQLADSSALQSAACLDLAGTATLSVWSGWLGEEAWPKQWVGPGSVGDNFGWVDLWKSADAWLWTWE